MGTLALQAGSPTTLTVSVPQPNFYSVSSARLYLKIGGRPGAQFSPSSSSRDSIVFSFQLSTSQLRKFAHCGTCSWRTEGTYEVKLDEGAQLLDPPFKVIDSGSVTVAGSIPCSDCGGDDPPGPEDPPPGDDNPFGDPSNEGDPLIPGPDAPPDQCLPPSFTATPPTVPTPCGGGSGGSGNIAFSGN
jgi:hypothetical protein